MILSHSSIMVMMHYINKYVTGEATIMADIKLFRVGAKVKELKSSAVDLEKKL